MSLSKTLFGENIYLLNVDEFSQVYDLIVKNTFVMGKENPSVSLKTKSEIIIDQEKVDDFIHNRIELIDIVGETENATLKPFLQQSLALADISKELFVKRNLEGKILSVEKQEKLLTDWQLWKEQKLTSVFPTEKEQTVFAKNYENGLKDFEIGFKKNLQYLFLLPEIYSVIFPPNQHYLFLSDYITFTSRLVENMDYNFQLKLVKLEEEKDVLSVELHAVLNNKEDITKSHLNSIYDANEEFSLSDFDFSIKIKYNLERATSKIISGTFNFCEKLHDHLSYSINMDLEEFSTINL